MKYYTTLHKIRYHNPCGAGWKKLLLHLGKSETDDEPVALCTILESNGISDAIWALRAVDGIERDARLFACDCAEAVAHLNTDPRVRNALDVARRYAMGQATGEERDAAWDAAWAAAWAVEFNAPRSAPRDAQTKLFQQYFCE